MQLDWDGFVNARDLGGLPTTDGATTRPGVIVRSEHPSHLTSSGWEALRDYGVRTIVSLETAGLQGESATRANRPVSLPGGSGIRVVAVPIEDAHDAEFVERWVRTGLWGTPIYFAWALHRWPQLVSDALRVVADASGTVLIHCGRGQDRTGLLSLALLAFADVELAAITDDYLLSRRNLSVRNAGAHQEMLDCVSSFGMTTREAVAAAVTEITSDFPDRAGLDVETVARLRRLLR